MYTSSQDLNQPLAQYCFIDRQRISSPPPPHAVDAAAAQQGARRRMSAHARLRFPSHCNAARWAFAVALDAETRQDLLNYITKTQYVNCTTHSEPGPLRHSGAAAVYWIAVLFWGWRVILLQEGGA